MTGCGTSNAARRVVAVLSVLVAGAFGWVPGAAAADPLADAHQLTDLVNAERTSRGLGSLTTDVRLVRIASIWTASMAETQELAHNPELESLLPDGWVRSSENVGYAGTIPLVHEALMNSAGHRANILDPHVNAIGVGVAYSPNRVWVTESFMSNSRLVSVPDVVGTGPGYRLAARDGAVTTFADVGSFGPITSANSVVGGAATPSGGGYWLVDSAGRVQGRGDAAAVGSLEGVPLAAPIVGMAATATGNGYWLLGRDGGIFSFGDAGFFGSTGAIRLNQPVVGVASTRSGRGYWLVAADGGIFSFGDAAFVGSTGAVRLNQPIVGMAADMVTNGYWLVARDGGIFSFGGVPFLGSTGAIRLNQPIVGMAPTASGRGYRFVAADGGVFTFGDAGYRGSLGESATAPVVALLPTP